MEGLSQIANLPNAQAEPQRSIWARKPGWMAQRREKRGKGSRVVRRWWLQWLGVICALFLAFFVFAVLLGPRFLPGFRCDERLLKAVESPDRRYVAALFRRDCGATTRPALHVNIRPATRSFAIGSDGTITEGSVFVADHVEGADVRWTGPRVLQVVCPAGRAFQRLAWWEDVHIAYAR